MGYRLKLLKCMLSNIKWNIYTYLYTLIHKRRKDIWVFGAWMGEKFADNSRSLFQYLHENKERFQISDVIWATRNPEVKSMLSNMGYHVVLIGTKESKKAHLLSGIHVICNSDGNNCSNGDIETIYSLGAKKIQLWHGVGIKASGLLKNENKTHNMKIFFHKNVVRRLCTPGHWSKCYFLTTSDESERVIHADNDIPLSHLFRGTYPRLCECVRLLDSEKQVIDRISALKNCGYRIVLYLPTFRGNNNKYLMPEETPNFKNFLKENKIYWIQKKHSADKLNSDFVDDDSIIGLNNSFDINVIYKYIDLLVTDYSSAASDAMFWNKPTLEYCPDFEKYQYFDRGFVGPFENYHVYPPVIESEKIQSVILERLECPDKSKIQKIKEFLYGSGPYSYEVTMDQILRIISRRK